MQTREIEDGEEGDGYIFVARIDANGTTYLNFSEYTSLDLLHSNISGQSKIDIIFAIFK